MIQAAGVRLITGLIDILSDTASMFRLEPGGVTSPYHKQADRIRLSCLSRLEYIPQAHVQETPVHAHRPLSDGIHGQAYPRATRKWGAPSHLRPSHKALGLHWSRWTDSRENRQRAASRSRWRYVTASSRDTVWI